jgi:hypothetical protein
MALFQGNPLQIGSGVTRFELDETESTFVAHSIQLRSFIVFCLHNRRKLFERRLIFKIDRCRIDCFDTAKTHFTFGTACDALERIRPKRAWFTRIDHRVTHAQAEAWIEGAMRE